MSKAKTTSDFIRDSKAVFGEDWFDYSRVNYRSNQPRVEIGCPKHGFFSIAPCHHFRHPYGGCKICRREEGAPLISGFGINDVVGGANDALYCKWAGAIHRCYDSNAQIKAPTYKDCSVCDEWRYLSNFLKWAHDPMNGYIEGYELDKDILHKGNRVYGPNTCCFVPREINIVFSYKRKYNGLPIGVSYDADYGAYYSQLRSVTWRWLGYHSTPEEAFAAYKTAKEAYIKEVATSYYNEGKIIEKVYNALMNYQVEITD